MRKIKNLCILTIVIQIIYMNGQCLRSYPQTVLNGLKKYFNLVQILCSDEGYFLEIDVQYLEKLNYLLNDLTFLRDRMKIEKFEKPVPKLYDKENMLFTKEIQIKH